MCEEYKNAGRFCQPKENKIYETEPLHFSVQIWLWACCWCSITKSVWLFVTPWNAACPATLSCTISWSLLKFTPIVLVMLSNHSSSSASLTFCLQSFPASGSSPKSCFFVSSGQSTGASASASLLLWILKSWFPSGLTGLIYLQSTGLSKVFSGMTIQSISSSVHSLFNGPTLTSLNDYWKKNYSFD